MPEYLYPGVYVEEVSFRSKSIDGVSTTTTGFVGACRYGPTELAPDVITSLAEFERVLSCNDQAVVVDSVSPLRSQDLGFLLCVATVRNGAGKAEIGDVEPDKFR